MSIDKTEEVQLDPITFLNIPLQIKTQYQI